VVVVCEDRPGAVSDGGKQQVKATFQDVFHLLPFALLMDRTLMMRRRAAEINLFLMARPHMKKTQMPDGIKRHKTEK
jgi:hypothetical protein